MRLFIRFFLAIVSITLTFTSQAQTLVRAMEGVTEYRLANGLQVLLAPNDLQPRTYVNLVVKAGSSVEGFGEGGMAHLLEHMVFKGTPTTPDPMAEFAKRSLTAGGTTTLDRTNYVANMNVNADNLQWYLTWLADAMFNSSIRKEDLDKEMSVVRNEFERIKSNDVALLAELRMALTFANHSYGRPVFGNLSDIENASVERLRAFYKTWYRVDNMTIVITGRFDATRALKDIQTRFGAIDKPSTPLPKMYTREAVQNGIRGTTIRHPGGKTMTLISWRGAPYAHVDDAALIAVAHALVSPAGGRFDRALADGSIGFGASAAHVSMAQYGLFTVLASAAESSKLDAIQSLLLRQIQNIVDKGVTEEELARIQAAVHVGYENFKNNAESQGAFLADAIAAGDWRVGFWQRENFSKLTRAAVQDAAKRYLVNANRVRVSYVPDEQSTRAPEAAPQDLGDFVARTTALGKANDTLSLSRFAVTGSEIERHIVRSQLKSGTRIALLPRPVVGNAIHGRLHLHWGNLEALAGSSFKAAQMGELITYGIQGKSAEKVIDELNAIESGLVVNSGSSGLFINFKTTHKNWPAFSVLLGKMLHEPQLSAASFQVWKRTKIQHLESQKHDPRERALKEFYRTLYVYNKDDSRYTPTFDEAIANWQSLTYPEVIQFWAQYVGSAVSEFSAVGALDAREIQRDVALILEDWKPSSIVYARIPSPLPIAKPVRIIVPTLGKPNALLLSSQRIAAQAYSREWMAMFLASNMIGQRGSSRLFNRLRKEEGLTYDTVSSISGFEDDGVIAFSIEGTFAPQNLARFEQVLQETLADIQNVGFTEQELAQEKKMDAQRIQAGRENDASMATSLVNNEKRMREGKRSDFLYWDEIQAIVQSLTLNELNAAAAKLANGAQSTTVIAGDFEKK